MQVGQGQAIPPAPGPYPPLTVENIVALVQQLEPEAAVAPVLEQTLFGYDSRAAAALFKELSKAGLTHRAFELFDWLRSLPPQHQLQRLCDVFTYTTSESLTGCALKNLVHLGAVWLVALYTATTTNNYSDTRPTHSIDLGHSPNRTRCCPWPHGRQIELSRSSLT